MRSRGIAEWIFLLIALYLGLRFGGNLSKISSTWINGGIKAVKTLQARA